MDQIKTGRFIAEQRKKRNLTQAQLAEKLNITDRAVSKWERGKSLPDASIMLELCSILDITVNDLLCGEIVTMDNYKNELESNLLEVIQQKEQADKRLLMMEAVMGFVCMISLFTAIIIASTIPAEEWKQTLIVIAGLVPLLIVTPFALKIEQKAGYYVCSQCGHRYIPEYGRVFLAMHIGRTRYMRCPKCNKSSWQKKVLSKE